jgi:hypothetical protein
MKPSPAGIARALSAAWRSPAGYDEGTLGKDSSTETFVAIKAHMSMALAVEGTIRFICAPANADA